MPELSTANSPGAEFVAEVLASAYGLGDATLVRLPIGTTTVNYRATLSGRAVFVKVYSAAADLRAEREAISLTQRAGDHGVPIAAIALSASGEAITHHNPQTAVSVWEWVPGHIVKTGFDRAQQSPPEQPWAVSTARLPLIQPAMGPPRSSTAGCTSTLRGSRPPSTPCWA